MLIGEAADTNYNVFGLTRPGIVSTNFRTQGDHVNHYTTGIRYITDKTQWDKKKTTRCTDLEKVLAVSMLVDSSSLSRQKIDILWQLDKFSRKRSLNNFCNSSLVQKFWKIAPRHSLLRKLFKILLRFLLFSYWNFCYIYRCWTTAYFEHEKESGTSK